jgi:hypothetical protein
VQERRLAARDDGRRHLAHQRGGQAAAAEVGVAAHRADLRVPRHPHALAGHRHEAAVDLHAHEAAQLRGAIEPRARSRQLHERGHARHVVRPQRAHARGPRELAGQRAGHLHEILAIDQREPRPRIDLFAHRQCDHLVARHVRGQRRERGRRRGRQAGEAREVRLVAARERAAARQAGVHGRQRAPDDVVERMDGGRVGA